MRAVSKEYAPTLLFQSVTQPATKTVKIIEQRIILIVFFIIALKTQASFHLLELLSNTLLLNDRDSFNKPNGVDKQLYRIYFLADIKLVAGKQVDMYGASDLRKGLKVEIDGQPYIITEFNFTKPGKGQAIYTCKLKNLLNGSTLARNYRSNDKIDKCHVEEKPLVYSYPEGDGFVFMDEDYNQITISSSVLGDHKLFLTEGIEVDVLFHNNQPIDVTFPNFIERRVEYTEPGLRGDTATNVQKPAKLEGGYELSVPLFVNQGDLIKVDTRTGFYADRVAKA